MIFKWNLVFVTHFTEYQHCTLSPHPQVLKTNFMLNYKIDFYYLLKILYSFLTKNTFNNTGEKHIIHFMGLPVVF